MGLDRQHDLSSSRRRDLCVIARADGHVHRAEREVLEGMARDLGVPWELISATLDGSVDLD